LLEFFTLHVEVSSTSLLPERSGKKNSFSPARSALRRERGGGGELSENDLACLLESKNSENTKKQLKMNDKTIIELRYHKISTNHVVQ
jgi:hypothetical protein